MWRAVDYKKGGKTLLQCNDGIICDSRLWDAICRMNSYAVLIYLTGSSDTVGI